MTLLIPSFNIKDAGGQVVLGINDRGDLIASGGATFAGNVTASGSATFNKFRLSNTGPATSSTAIQATATGSAGLATLNATQNEITIINPNVTEDSLIYITPIGDTQNKVL